MEEKSSKKETQSGYWITPKILEDILSEHEEEELKVLESKVNPAVSIGDNYLSVIYRVVVKFERENGNLETRQLIIKEEPSVEYLKTMTQEHHIFRKELYMYNVCLPKMKEVMEQDISDGEDFLAPEIYKCKIHNVIVLQDLQESGYKMGDRNKQLDFEHAVVALRTLAMFHALSVKVKKSDETIFDCVSTNFYDEMDEDKLKAHISSVYVLWVKVVKSWPNGSRFGPMLENLGEYAYKKMMDAMRKVPDALTVLNHGDFWMNNILFGYDKDGKVAKAKFIDYQITRYTSPVLDLMYFLFTSVRPEVIMVELFQLIEVYWKSLSSYFSKLHINFSGITFEKIKRDFYDRSFFIIIVLATITPIIVAQPNNVLSFENVTLEDFQNTDKNPLETQWKASNYREIAEKYLHVLEKFGFLRENPVEYLSTIDNNI